MTTRVLICDDHEVVREGLRVLISRQQGMSVVAEAGTVGEAVDAAAKAKPDVVIMDVRLPDGSVWKPAERFVMRGPRPR